MANSSELMGLGTPPLVAQMLGFGTVSGTLTAAGTTSADALQLTNGVNLFGTVASGAGAKLPPASGAGPVAVINGGANAVLMYPATGEQINNGTATTGTYSVANAKTAIFFPAGNRWIATLST
jgi:hypothetical protein